MAWSKQVVGMVGSKSRQEVRETGREGKRVMEKTVSKRSGESLSGLVEEFIPKATRSGRTAESRMVKTRTRMKCGNRLIEDTEGEVGNREGYTGVCYANYGMGIRDIGKHVVGIGRKELGESELGIGETWNKK
ncbi:Hypothetical predicted protein [Paramuricea clavata]|uniref:Uncharacterized protein n=1 Tax=Paramuricea clavata TaxID=317549 RepID=A0A6S7G4X3_PARCT|nr:Hypothetical predicted protein [Paramuricea clavata]